MIMSKAKHNKHRAKENAAQARATVPAAEPAATATADAAGEPLSEELAAAMAEANDRYLRAKAELENYRKRVQREFAEIREYSKHSVIEEFLPVFDHFQMAMGHVGENADLATLKQGMDMILGEFRRTLENLGVEPIDAVAQPFDPNQHEAIAQEASEQVPEGHVLRQWKCGYRIGERLLRPATVVVSSGPAAEMQE